MPCSELFPDKFPEWLQEHLRKWRDRLELYEWDIRPSICVCPDEHDFQVEACCQQYPELNLCYLSFRSDIENNKNWRINAIHELLHVKHARIDRYLESVVFPETGSMTETAIKRGYRQHYETYIHGFAVALYNTFEETDFPKEEGLPDGEVKRKNKKRTA